MAVIVCAQCKRKAKNFGRGLCQTCYQSRFRIVYFQQYRSRPEYREQRLVYDIRYALKSEEKQPQSQKKSEVILTFSDN